MDMASSAGTGHAVYMQSSSGGTTLPWPKGTTLPSRSNGVATSLLTASLARPAGSCCSRGAPQRRATRGLRLRARPCTSPPNRSTSTTRRICRAAAAVAARRGARRLPPRRGGGSCGRPENTRNLRAGYREDTISRSVCNCVAHGPAVTERPRTSPATRRSWPPRSWPPPPAAARIVPRCTRAAGRPASCRCRPPSPCRRWRQPRAARSPPRRAFGAAGGAAACSWLG
eukprot:scaffold109112_cov57-Phaeocystis_antarctica.AAC.4